MLIHLYLHICENFLSETDSMFLVLFSVSWVSKFPWKWCLIIVIPTVIIWRCFSSLVSCILKNWCIGSPSYSYWLQNFWRTNLNFHSHPASRPWDRSLIRMKEQNDWSPVFFIYIVVYWEVNLDCVWRLDDEAEKAIS
jgi:hypothetical protein